MSLKSRIIIVKIGNFYIPDVEVKIKFIFNNCAEVIFCDKEIPIGEPDYIIGDFFREYTINNLISKIRSTIEIGKNDLVIGLINESIERNYFSHLIPQSQSSILSIKDIETFNIDLDFYIILGIVEHYLVYFHSHDWHLEERRCIFDFCANKKNITVSSKYLGLCDECRSKIGDVCDELIARTKGAIDNNYFYNPDKMMSVFFSYSHKDEEIKRKLDTALSSLKRSKKVTTWNDREIMPGTAWDDKIKRELGQANLILLLISADFLASDYIWNGEKKSAIKRHENKEAIVIPIFCRSCDFTDMPFSSIQGLPTDAKPLSLFEDIDEGLAIVAKGIRKVIDALNKIDI